MVVVAYNKGDSVYYKYDNRCDCYVARGELVSVSGNTIVYKYNGSIYSAELDEYGYVKSTGHYISRA